jgi:hypothetical protein
MIIHGPDAAHLVPVTVKSHWYRSSSPVAQHRASGIGRVVHVNPGPMRARTIWVVFPAKFLSRS